MLMEFIRGFQRRREEKVRLKAQLAKAERLARLQVRMILQKGLGKTPRQRED